MALKKWILSLKPLNIDRQYPLLLSAFLNRKPVQNQPIMTIFSCNLGLGKTGGEEKSDHTVRPADFTTINT